MISQRGAWVSLNVFMIKKRLLHYSIMCKEWLQAKGNVEAMDGPINFGPRDRWWGLLIEGYNLEPNYQCNYNFQYYKDFLRSMASRYTFTSFTYGRKMAEPLSDKLWT
jgi:hypothetical protein